MAVRAGGWHNVAPTSLNSVQIREPDGGTVFIAIPLTDGESGGGTAFSRFAGLAGSASMARTRGRNDQIKQLFAPLVRFGGFIAAGPAGSADAMKTVQ